MREQAGDSFKKTAESIEKPENETIKKMKETLAPALDKMSAVTNVVKDKVGAVGGKGLDYIQGNLKHLQDEKKTKGLEQWQKVKAAQDKYYFHLQF